MTLDMDNGDYTVSITARNEAGMGSVVSRSFTVNMPSTAVKNLKTGISFTGASARAGVITYSLATDGLVSLSVFDLRGRTIMALNRACKAGQYSVSLGKLSPGSYIVAFKAGGYSINKMHRIF
jgi:hypothetical protein